MSCVIGRAVPCGPRSMKYEVEEKVIDVACDERTIFACFAEDSSLLEFEIRIRLQKETRLKIFLIVIRLLFQFVRVPILTKSQTGALG